jgi:hypothetical protein
MYTQRMLLTVLQRCKGLSNGFVVRSLQPHTPSIHCRALECQPHRPPSIEPFPGTREPHPNKSKYVSTHIAGEECARPFQQHSVSASKHQSLFLKSNTSSSLRTRDVALIEAEPKQPAHMRASNTGHRSRNQGQVLSSAQVKLCNRNATCSR